MGWQGLFIVAGIGALIICLGVGFQILQIIVSVIQRKDNLDTTGDPWDARTLEWSTASPPPFYNFAIIPQLSERDPFWEMKQSRKVPAQPEYTDILLPKNTPIGIYIAGCSIVLGFALIWHILWLIPVAILGILALVVIRSLDYETEYVVKAAQIAKIEAATSPIL
jgi:cytochrome o ubiquinol oxidase subunit 1